MTILRLLLTTLLITSLISPQVLAESGSDPEATEAIFPSSSPVIEIGGSSGDSSGLSALTSEPSTVYPEGIYHAGTDIPVGEYVLLADPSAEVSDYTIYGDGIEGSEYVDYNMFDYNAIIYIDDRQTLDLSGCTASPINEVPQIDHFYGNMYKVGYHIPAGTYKVKAADSTSFGIAYVLSYPSNDYAAVEDYAYVNDTAFIAVNDGQYLQLSDCILTDTASADSVIPDNARSYESWLDRWLNLIPEPDDEEPQSSVITAGSLIAGLPTRTSSPSTVYQPGTYQVGTDIPAGEYVLLGNNRDEEEYFYSIECTYIISNGSDPQDTEQLTDYGFFHYNHIVRVEDGQYLTLDNCTASPIDEVPSLDYRAADHFKVGYHIPAGTYYFTSDAYGAAYVMSAPTQSYEDIVEYETISPDSGSQMISVTLQEGQYLLLMDCVFTDNGLSAGSSGPGGAGTDSLTTAALDYLRQMYGGDDEDDTSPVITAPTEGGTLSSATSVPSTVYPAGSYQVGTEIPAGEYILLRADAADTVDSSYEYSTGYVISTVQEATDYDQIIDYNYFSYNAIIRVSEGQFLKLSNCTASPVNQVPQLDYSRGEMYKVGLQLPAGTYRLKATEGIYSGGRAYVLSAPSDNYEDVEESFTIEDGEYAVVTVKNGQYLQLKDCIVTEEITSDGSFAGPAFNNRA